MFQKQSCLIWKEKIQKNLYKQTKNVCGFVQKKWGFSYLTMCIFIFFNTAFALLCHHLLSTHWTNERMVWQKRDLSGWDTSASGFTIWSSATKKAHYRRFVGSELQRFSWDSRCTFQPNVAHIIAQVFPFNCVHHKYSGYLFHQSKWKHILCEPSSDFPWFLETKTPQVKKLWNLSKQVVRPNYFPPACGWIECQTLWPENDF